MDKKLYPLKFHPIIKKNIWGGKKLDSILKKDIGMLETAGESWEISAVKKNISIAANGFLKNKSLVEIIEEYKSRLVGNKVYQKFGLEFPLLIKFIDANDKLSIQVHPDDALAGKRHNSFGKTEMWYVLKAEKNAKIIVGFNQKMNKKTYLEKFNSGRLESILNKEKAKKGSCFFLPAGRVHAIGKGILLAEIQQTSDITYRIFDWNRTQKDGTPREMHTKLAMDAIDFDFHEKYFIDYLRKKNESVQLVDCKYFKSYILDFDKTERRHYTAVDSFVIYICVKGEFMLETPGHEKMKIKKGETVLIPAELNTLKLIPIKKSKILEVSVP